MSSSLILESLQKEPSIGVVALAYRGHHRISKKVDLRTWLVESVPTGSSQLLNPLLCHSSARVGNLEIQFLAQGGYNDIWLVRCRTRLGLSSAFVLRVPTEDSLKLYQIRNEVGWLQYMAKNCSEVPVPKVYDYCDGSGTEELAFIAEEFAEASPLSDVWMTFSESEKDLVAAKIAALVVRMGELRFHHIGGMTPPGIACPTVEGSKLFKGRDRYHQFDCYDIGPYCSTKQYVLAQYDKEIYYHINADSSMLDADLFETTTALQFAETLKVRRATAEEEFDKTFHEEPFVLCHNDLQGRNILMRGTEIAAVIDWEFAGSYPLSELNDLGIDLVEYESDEHEEQNDHWASKIVRELVPKMAAERGWSPIDIELLTSGGKSVIQKARIEMIPEDVGRASSDSQSVEGDEAMGDVGQKGGIER